MNRITVSIRTDGCAELRYGSAAVVWDGFTRARCDTLTPQENADTARRIARLLAQEAGVPVYEAHTSLVWQAGVGEKWVDTETLIFSPQGE